MTKTLTIFAAIVLLAVTAPSYGQHRKDSSIVEIKIQTALLLDISGSMEGLLAQTKFQFWNAVSFLNRASRNKKKPAIELALITYGGTKASGEDCARIMTNMTSELDSVANLLYEVKGGGGFEFCWSTIDLALDGLKWSVNKHDLRILIIAGNESFDQGTADAKPVLKKARKLDIPINTIYCFSGDNRDSVSWASAARLGKGKFSSIDIRDSSFAKETSLDHKLIEFNNKLNATYLPYGKNGSPGLKRLLQQDCNAKIMGLPMLRERIAHKATEHFKNPSWDIVDAFAEDSTLIEKLHDEALPAALKDLSLSDRKAYLDDIKFRRDTYRQAINMRYERIRKYLGDQGEKETLDKSIKLILEEEGKKKGFAFN